MGFKLYATKGTELFDITEISGNITWSDSVDTLGMQLDFSVGVSSERYFPKFQIDCGDIVIIKNNIEIFRGIIITKNYSSNTEQTFTAFDFCYYLNKSKVIKQFNKMNADSAIAQICGDIKIKVGSIAAMSTSIEHIYYDRTVAEIIDDILQQVTNETGKKYIKEMQGDSFYIFEYLSKPIVAQFKPASNIEPFDVTLAIGNPNRTLSIEEMKNSVLIVSGGEKSVRVLATAKDKSGIEKYGLLQEITSVDDKDKNKVQHIANTKLKELNKVIETSSIELLGDSKVRAGRVISVIEEYTGMKGDYFIKSCNHTLSGGIHTMSVELEAIL